MSNNVSEHSNRHPGFEKLMDRLPKKLRDFSGTEFSQPAAMAYFGHKADVERLRKNAEELRTALPEQMCEIAMVMAEMIEAAATDRDKYFITDEKTNY